LEGLVILRLLQRPTYLDLWRNGWLAVVSSFAANPLINAVWRHPVPNRGAEHEWRRGLFTEAAGVVAAG